MLLLEPRDDLPERWVVLEFEAIPQRPLRRPVLVLLGLYRFRETEERQGEIDEPIFVLIELILSINDLMEEAWDPLIREFCEIRRDGALLCIALGRPGPQRGTLSWLSQG